MHEWLILGLMEYWNVLPSQAYRLKPLLYPFNKFLSEKVSRNSGLSPFPLLKKVFQHLISQVPSGILNSCSRPRKR
jgi:hypothetical protein